VRGAGITDFGGPVRTLDLPDPAASGPDDVLFEVHAAGVGNWDDVVRTGGWDVGASPPMALGVEASGVVRSVGPAVSRFQPGDEVLTHAVPLRQGSWAELFVAQENQISQKPKAMSFEVAAALSVPLLTAAEVLLRTVILKPGETLLINGGGGVTGGMLVAIGAQIGARVIATADPRSAERLRSYGASAVLDYHRADWQTEVRRLAGGSGVPVVVNAVRGAAPGLMSLVADGGRLATITNEPLIAERAITVSGFFVHPDGVLLERQTSTFAERGLMIPVGAVYPLAEAQSALDAAVAGRLGGAIVVDPRA
jgi:NADPH:quinone reductase-like Zn-dependent oxidoreductase